MSDTGKYVIELCSWVPPTAAIVPLGQTNPERSYRLVQETHAGHDLDMGIGNGGQVAPPGNTNPRFLLPTTAPLKGPRRPQAAYRRGL